MEGKVTENLERHGADQNYLLSFLEWQWDIMKMEFEEGHLGCKQGGDLGSKETGKDEVQ